MLTHRHVQHCSIEFGGLRLRHWRLRGGMAVVEVVEYHWWLWVDSIGFVWISLVLVDFWR